jgi:hypothetical protein
MELASNSNANNTGSAAVHAASGSTNRKPASAHQLIRENVKFLIEQLEAGHSETFTAYLNAMARFHNYSFGNVLLIARQKLDATHVAGIRTWNSLGRFVKRGEKGIAILAPVVSKKRNRNSDSKEQSNGSDENVVTLLGFRRVFVWDQSSTESSPLPEFHKTTGEVGEYLDRLKEFVAKQGIELTFDTKIAPALGKNLRRCSPLSDRDLLLHLARRRAVKDRLKRSARSSLHRSSGRGAQARNGKSKKGTMKRTVKALSLTQFTTRASLLPLFAPALNVSEARNSLKRLVAGGWI